MRFSKILFIVIVSTLLTACASSMQPLPANPSPLVIASCPEKLPALTDPSFGATTAKLAAVAGQYHECRRAAMAQ